MRDLPGQIALARSQASTSPSSRSCSWTQRLTPYGSFTTAMNAPRAPPSVPWRACARALLSGERTALIFLQHLSGIATLARQFVAAAGSSITILDTRKTTPTVACA